MTTTPVHRAPGPLHAPRALDVNIVCELSQETFDGPFSVALIREETRWWDDDPTPDIIETIVGETELRVFLPDVFSAVDHWLANTHHLHVLPTTWTSGNTGADTGVVVLLAGRTTPATQAVACA